MFMLSLLLLGGCAKKSNSIEVSTVNLPAVTLSVKEVKLKIYMDENNNLFINNVLSSEATLREKIQIKQQEAQAREQTIACIIEVDSSVPYENLIHIIDLIKQEGVNDLVLATTPEKDEL